MSFKEWLKKNENVMVSGGGSLSPEDNALLRRSEYRPVKEKSRIADKLFGVKRNPKLRSNQISGS